MLSGLTDFLLKGFRIFLAWMARFVRLSIALSGLCLGLLLVWLLLGFQQRTDLWPPSPAILQRLHLTPIVAAFKKLAAGVTRNSRYTVLANNMHRMRLMLETYPVTGGHYPPDVDTLYQDASRQNYWWGFRNPFDQGIIHHYREWMADYARYQQFSDKRSYRGKVLYEPIGTPPAGYRIYGCDENGALVRRENGDVYLLSNQLP